jgi:glutamine cyclotransferase
LRLGIAVVICALAAVSLVPPEAGAAATQATTLPASGDGLRGAPVYGFRIVNAYPHDRAAFTQGLVFANDRLYEGTGLYGRSSLREVDLETGRVLRKRQLPDALFGEGITFSRGRLVQLTWRAHLGLVVDEQTFALVRTFHYPTEGWGITFDGQLLIMSDGSATLHFLQPEDFRIVRQIHVNDSQRPVNDLNELEYVRGEIYANVWKTNRIARIDPNSGRVVGWIDLTGLLSDEQRLPSTDVLNGIAYDARHNRLFVTGKLWPKLFEIELLPE